ncbi:MAG: MoaD/ThiS family protein [Promethearchaeota archaeon]
MEQQTDQTNIGILNEFKAKGERKVSDLLKELKLDNKFFAILIDGKKANLKDTIRENQNIVVLPKIAGG